MSAARNSWRRGRRAVERFAGAGSANIRLRLALIYGVVALLNLGAWGWVCFAFHGKPVLLGIASLVYGLGLRHAVDADHIAAIDNVTRKLMHEGKRPAAVGFYFALGHSSVVFLMAACVAGMAARLDGFARFNDFGATIGTTVSALFLFAIAAMNLVIFLSVLGSCRGVSAGGGRNLEDPLAARGLLARALRPLFRLVGASWHMFPLGLLFGLGFDTATEVAMFGVSAAQAAKGMSLAAILVFPALFAAGMALIDTTDGAMMLGAYNWAFINPVRKLYYNLTITLLSAVVALVVGGIEALGLVQDADGALWGAIRSLNADFANLGFVVIGVFLGAWLFSWAFHRARKLARSAGS